MKGVRGSAAWFGVLLVAGCGPQGPVSTPITWWHNLQGGAIAEQRPPPPGLDAPYPLVGTTPARPVVTSAAVRDSLTASLIEQQDASHQIDTHDPIQFSAPAKGVTPQPGAAPAPPPPSMATLDAAGGTAPLAPGQTAPPPLPPKPVPTPEQQEASEPVLAMPPPPPGTTILAASGPLPQMPRTPPAPPSFAGFDIPATPLGPVRPDFAGRTAHLSNIAFQPGSDVLLPDDRATLRRLASSRGTASVRVDGHGDARSDTPDGQAAALRLGAARAAAAASALEQLGVPDASIEVAASAFGRGGSITVVK